MANGKTHTITTVTIGAAGGILMSYIGMGGSAEFFAGSLFAVFVQPDLDHPGGYIGDAIIGSIPVVGGVLRALWRVYWTPYRLFVGLMDGRKPGARDSHRSWLSHLPGIGTAIRIVWSLIPLFAFRGLFIPPPPFLVAVLLCDIAHAVLDAIWW